MARLVPSSRPSTAGSQASSTARPSSSQSTATNFSRPLSTGARRYSNASLAPPSTRPTSMASSMDIIAETDQETPKQETRPDSTVWRDEAGRFGGRWAYVTEKPKALYDTDSEPEDDPTPQNGTPASGRRSKRISRLSAVQLLDKELTPSLRNVSGATLVPEDGNNAQPVRHLLDNGIRALDMDWEVQKFPQRQEQDVTMDNKVKKQTSRLSTLGNAIASTVSVLGKRGRQAILSGKEKLQLFKDEKKLGKRASMAMLDADETGDHPRKRVKVEVKHERLLAAPVVTPAAPHLHGWQRKRWLGKGLYIGQERDFDARLNEARNKKKRASTASMPVLKQSSHNKTLPPPMFTGERLLEQGHRDFKLPFDVFCPLPPGHSKPDAWGKFQTNRFVGDAATEWKHHKQLPPSRCLCTAENGCDEDCQNRYMLYECDESNCNLGTEACSNRSFADLKERSRSGKKYDIGVEVVKTEAKGYGVRACRTFEPGQIVMEYAGEIITQEECERRVATEYKDNECYYLMTFDQNMIIDATRGSIARFINHSCEPNCQMVKWIVAGKPRMALFAGDDGIMTGEELTYDYNFDPFSQKNVQKCHCGAPTCRGFLGPKPNKTTARLSRSASADDVDAVEPKRKKSVGLLNNARRSIQSLQSLLNFEPTTNTSDNSRKRKSTGSASALLKIAKKRRRNTDTPDMDLEDQDDEVRIPSSSTGATLVEQAEPEVAKGKTSDKVSGVKRRNTIDALRGAAKKLKRSGSTLRMHATLHHANEKEAPADETEENNEKTVSRSTRAAKRSSMVPKLEKLELDFAAEQEQVVDEVEEAEGEDVMGKAAVFGQPEDDAARRPTTSASTSSVIFPGIVRSVKGSRRVAAAKRAGLKIGKKVEKSMRVVTNDAAVEEDE